MEGVIPGRTTEEAEEEEEEVEEVEDESVFEAAAAAGRGLLLCRGARENGHQSARGRRW